MDGDGNPINVLPTANAGPDRRVRLGSLVTLDGRSSVDPDHGPSPLAFEWTQRAGPAVVLSDPTSSTPTFVPTTPGTYTFLLIVNDGLALGRPDEVTITVPRLGDINGDGAVDNDDLNLILAARNTPANGPNDLRDLDGDGRIDALDARKLTQLCTRRLCATR